MGSDLQTRHSREWGSQPPQRAGLKDARGTLEAVQNMWESVSFID